MARSTPTSTTLTHDIAAARQAEVIAFLHRVPFVLEGLNLGYLPGFREDCGYQTTQFDTLDIPVGMLDNDFRNPDIERFVNRFFEYEPRVGVVGDAYDRDDVTAFVAGAREIRGSFPDADLVIVPKCRGAIDAIPDDIILGYEPVQ